MTVILVTGGNQGLGYALIERLGKEHKDYTILLGARSRENGEAAVKKLAAEGVEATFVQLDVCNDEDIKAAVAFVEEKYGKLDVLVNNAGISQFGAPESREESNKIFETNVISTGMVSNAFHGLLANAKGAKVLMISSALGSLQYHQSGVFAEYYKKFALMIYAATKSALNMYTIVYSKKWADDKIKVVAIDPGYAATNINNYMGGKSPSDGIKAAYEAIVTDDWEAGRVYKMEPDDEQLVAIPF